MPIKAKFFSTTILGYRQALLIACFIVLGGIASCQSASDIMRDDRDPAVSSDKPESDGGVPDGYWEQRGHNRVLHIVGGETRAAWIVGSNYCYEDYPWPEVLDRTNSGPNGTITAFESGGITRYAFDRRPAIPAKCSNKDSYNSTDPELNFDVFWRHFDENYAFFDTYGVDWLETYRRIRPKIGPHTTDTELWAAMQEALSPIRDGHITIGNNNGQDWSPGRKTPYLLAVDEHFQQPDVAARYPELEPANREDQFEADYAFEIKDNVMSSVFGSAFDGRIVWGEVRPGVGYLWLAAMSFTDSDSALNDVIAVTEVLDNQVLTDFSDMQALVIDTRLNGGGWDASALAIASRFAKTRCPAFSKAPPGTGYPGLAQQIWLEPDGPQTFTDQIALLTSSETASAAEIFLLAMRGQPHVTVIGNATEGVLSDVWEGRMPNGWSIRLSNETYLAPDGKAFESIGIPPDLQVNIFDGKDMVGSLARSLDFALSQMSSLASRPKCRFTEFTFAGDE